MATLETPADIFLTHMKASWKTRHAYGRLKESGVGRFLRKNSALRPLIVERCQTLDEAVRRFNRLKGAGRLVSDEQRRLAETLPGSYRLPTLHALVHDSHQEDFWHRLFRRIDRGDYPFFRIEDPEALTSLGVLTAYALAVRSDLAAKRVRPDRQLPHIIASGLSDLAAPGNPLFGPLFRPQR